MSHHVEGYKDNADLIHKFTNPQTIADHLFQKTASLYKAAPNITQGLHSTVNNGIAFLQSKLPMPTNELPLAPKHDPSAVEKHRFNGYYDIVHDPLSALKHVKHGTLKDEHMEALQTVYPSLLGDMRKKVMEHMDVEKAKSLKYSTKMSLSRFLGQPLDENMLPQNITANQVALAGATQTGNVKPTQGGLKSIDLADRSQTQVQDSERNPKDS